MEELAYLDNRSKIKHRVPKHIADEAKAAARRSRSHKTYGWSSNTLKRQLIEVATHRSGNSSNPLLKVPFIKKYLYSTTHRKDGNSSNILI
jgi:hypothetical protein